MLKHFGSVLAFLVLSIVLVQAANDIEATAARVVDISTQFVSNIVSFEITNRGKSDLKTFEFVLETQGLAYYRTAFGQSTNEALTVIETRNEEHNGIQYTVYKTELPTPVKPGESASIHVSAIYSHRLTPLPREITQRESQFMLYQGNHYIDSVFPLVSQQTEIHAQRVLSHSTDPAPASKDSKETVVSFGPYENVPVWSYAPSRVHHLNSAPFITITKMIKEIEVSHWGNVAVEEWLWVQHDGARLKGGFSRLDFMRGAHGNAIPRLIEWLPQGASDVYYRDVIGNISSSHVFPHESNVKFEIGTRFVLFGGWKTEFYTGHNLPAHQYISIDDQSRYVVRVPFINEIEQAVVDELEFHVILPEGASNVRIETPFETSGLETSKRFTYLDTSGRTEVRFSAKNLLPLHKDEDLVISYDFQKSAMLQEPLLLIGGFFSLFIALIFFFRLDFSIGSAKSSNESVLADLFDRVQAVYNSREEAVQNLLKASAGNAKNTLNSFQASLPKFTNDLKTITDRVSSSAQNSNFANDLRELEKVFARKVDLAIKRANLLTTKAVDQKRVDEITESIQRVSEEFTEGVQELAAYFQ